jgi:hypothetical protein
MPVLNNFGPGSFRAFFVCLSARSFDLLYLQNIDYLGFQIQEMKKEISLFIAILFSASLVFFACKKPSEGEGTSTTYKSEATTTGNPNVTSGTGSTTVSNTSSTTGGTTT